MGASSEQRSRRKEKEGDMRALVIDDSKTMRLILGRLLRELGFEVAEAGDGQKGLERLREGPRPVLALVDWNMPVMNGLEFIQAVRADDSYAQMLMMMVTTESGPEQITQALEAGANEYVMKPFTKETIRAKLNVMGFDLP